MADLAINWACRYGVRLLGLGIVDAPTIQRAENGAGVRSRHDDRHDPGRRGDAGPHRRVGPVVDQTARQGA